MERCHIPWWELLNWGAPDSVSSSLSLNFLGFVIQLLASLARNFIWGCHNLSDPSTFVAKIALLRWVFDAMFKMLVYVLFLWSRFGIIRKERTLLPLVSQSALLPQSLISLTLIWFQFSSTFSHILIGVLEIFFFSMLQTVDNDWWNLMIWFTVLSTGLIQIRTSISIPREGAASEVWLGVY